MTAASLEEEEGSLSLLFFLKFIANGWGSLSMFFWVIIVAFVQAPPSEGPQSVAGLTSGAYMGVLFVSSILLAVGGLLSLWLFGRSDGVGSSRRRYGRWLGLGSLLLVDTMVIFHAGNVFHGGLSTLVSVFVIVAAGISAAWFVRLGLLSWGLRAFGAGAVIAIAPWFVAWDSLGSGPFMMTLLLVPLFSSLLLAVDLLLVWPPAPAQEEVENPETPFDVMDVD